MSIPAILEELNLENGTKYKLEVLKKHKENELLQKVFKMALCKVTYTYGIRKIPEHNPQGGISLEDSLDVLTNELATRELTGNDAIAALQETLNKLSPEDADVICKIIDRDLKVNVGRSQANKVWKGLIVKPVYNRCDIYGEKTSKNIKFPAIVQLKADGTYREFNVSNGKVECVSRSGESYEYPVIFEQMKTFPDGHYTGELTIEGLTNRAEANGLINSDNPPHDDIILELWDFISDEEYQKAGLKDKKNPCKVGYEERWNELVSILSGDYEFSPAEGSKNIKLIPYKIVDTLQEALAQTSEWMTAGFEGAILKDWGMVFKDGTSKQQLKLKLEIDADVRITGFVEGTKGTKREKTFGAIMFETDDGQIKGQTSGFTDAQLEDFNSRREELIGKIMAVQFNDLTKGRDNDYYALSHPRFIELRDDKEETDTLERVFESRDMAMLLS